MGRRTQKTELEFGSDSFLDVIANMVGILIILIVITGLRAGNAPPSETLLEQARAESSPSPLPEPASPELHPTSPPIPSSKGPPLEVTRKLEELDQESSRLERQLRLKISRSSELREEYLRQSETLAAARDFVQTQVDSKNSTTQATESTAVALQKHKTELTQLLSELEQLEKQVPRVKRLKHRVTPISRSVDSEEFHFRLSDGKVSIIPFKDLLERMKGQAERQKEWLAKNRVHRGTVGPLDGYRIQYVLERQSLSGSEQMQLGQGYFRIVVSSFEIVPGPDIVTETTEQALRPGSRFLKAVRQAPQESTITFWVYPDSFAIYRRLQSAVHELGHSVAARPLPTGMPISGSPQGSRSAGQ